MTAIKLKHSDTQTNKSLRVQYWSGELPTYDSEQQRAAVHRAALFGTDENGNPLPDNQDNKALEVGTTAGSPVPNETAQAQAQAAEDTKAANADGIPVADQLANMSKDDLLAHAEATGVTEVNAKMKKQEIADAIAAASPKTANGEVASPASGSNPTDTAGNKVPAKYEFTPENLLQELTLSPGEEKVLDVTAGCFITIKEE